MRQKCREFTAETHAEIIRAYKSKMSIDDLAKKYLVCRSTLYYWFRSIYRIKCRGRKLFNDSVEKDILKEYVSGKSYSDLMEKYNCSSNTIWSILRRQNCPVKGHVLFHHPRWNGGISYSEKGYKRLYMPGNPSSTSSGRGTAAWRSNTSVRKSRSLRLNLPWAKT